MTEIDIENKRKLLQKTLDSLKTQKERNVLGQFSTPYRLANDIFIKAKHFYLNSHSCFVCLDKTKLNNARRDLKKQI